MSLNSRLRKLEGSKGVPCPECGFEDTFIGFRDLQGDFKASLLGVGRGIGRPSGSWSGA
jgi:hypothetical protein